MAAEILTTVCATLKSFLPWVSYTAFALAPVIFIPAIIIAVIGLTINQVWGKKQGPAGKERKRVKTAKILIWVGSMGVIASTIFFALSLVILMLSIALPYIVDFLTSIAGMPPVAC